MADRQIGDAVRVILVDDHTIIRDGIRALLKSSQDIAVIGEAASGKELIAMLPNNEVDVILMDINMPDMDGFETTAYLREKYPHLRILILSMLEQPNYVHKIIEAGASGYLLKNVGRDEMTCALKIVSGGGQYICSTISLALLRKFQPDNIKPVIAPELSQTRDLSQREVEILKLIADGLTNAEIADKIFTSKRTVETHRQNIIEKTKAKNTAALIKYAISKGII